MAFTKQALWNLLVVPNLECIGKALVQVLTVKIQGCGVSTASTDSSDGLKHMCYGVLEVTRDGYNGVMFSSE